MDFVLLTVGAVLVLLCLAQLGLWTATSLRNAVAEGKQLELRQQLIAQEIEAARRKAEVNRIENVAWQGFRRFVINKAVKESPTTTSLYLVPQDGKPLPAFLPGQHLTLRFIVPGEAKPIIRCYSLSDRPQPEYYRITVKSVPAPRQRPDLPPGRVSNYVNSGLQPGMLIDIKAPSGDFHLDMLDKRPAILLAGGIGITPMLSMAETVLADDSEREVLLFYGMQNGGDHIFKHRIVELADRHNNFNAITCYSSPRESDVAGKDFHVKGWVTVELMKKLLPSNNFHFYLCGPGPFMETIYSDLRAWDVSEEQIHFEAFGPASIKKKSKAAEPQTAEVSESAIVFAKSEQTIPWQADFENILDAAESADINLESGCRAGACGTCRLKLTFGKVKYPNGEPADLESGTCLPCVAVPDGKVELDA